jgi:hypothetical protein
MILKLLFSSLLIIIHSFLVIYFLGSSFQIERKLEDTTINHDLIKEGTRLAFTYLIVAGVCGVNILINLCILIIDLSKVIC